MSVLEPRLIHIIYSSAAATAFSERDLVDLLTAARSKNAAQGISGMLLYVDQSFLQVLEGPPDAVDKLFKSISRDDRHNQIVTIIRETIPRRAFADWSMGYAAANRSELAEIPGMNDFFAGAGCLQTLNHGRTKKLLTAFKEGRWRSRLATSAPQNPANTNVPGNGNVTQLMKPIYQFAFQPIVNTETGEIFSQEALLVSATAASGGLQPELFGNSAVTAFTRAAELQLTGGLSLNINVLGAEQTQTALQLVVTTADQLGIGAERLTFEVNQDSYRGDPEGILKVMQVFREIGIKICIDDFGAGRSGLQQIERHQPDSIALNERLVRGIESNGALQAIVRGITQTCTDLGIDVIVKHVKTMAEFHWFRAEGLQLFQGDLFALAASDQLPTHVAIPSREAA